MYPSREDILDLLRTDGPIASLYLRLGIETGTTTDRQMPLRWRAMRQELLDSGADDRTVKALADCVETATPGDRVLVAFAGDGQLLLSAELAECSIDDRGLFSPLPVLAPLLHWQWEQIPYIVALVDRTGAELTSYDGGARPIRVDPVTGPDDEIERNAPGGTAQARYQHRAEDSWQHNAAEVARHVSRLAEETRARLIVVAGDVRAVQLLREHLPEHLRAVLRTVSADGEHSSQGPARIRPRTIAATRREVLDERRRGLLRTLGDAVGTAGQAVQGVPETVLRLREAAVATLVVVDDPHDPRRVFVGPEPFDVAIRVDELPQPADAHEAPLVDAAIRAALRSHADVVVLTTDEMQLSDGIAAVLRT